VKLINLFKKSKSGIIGDAIVKNSIEPLKRIKRRIKPVTKKLYIALKRYIQPRNYDLVSPDYDFDIIQQAFNVDSILRRARNRYCELIWENGYEIVGKNPKTVHYIKKRLKQIAMVTETPTEVLLSEISEQLVLFYNAIVVKVRSEASSGGRRRTTFYGKKLLPVGGYFVMETPAIKAVTSSETGVLLGYNQELLYDRPKFYKKDDVIHITLDRQPEKLFGTPAVVAVLDDIRALRRMEENVEILVFQHAIPLIHYSVGTEEIPAEPDEITDAEVSVANMAANGMLVTPERHKLVAVGEGKSALRVDLYLEYFKSRIYLGLGQSAISLGEAGSSRGAAIALNKAVLGAAKRFQKRIRVYVNEFIINELLEEGGFDSFNDANKVELYIPEIDVDDKIRKEFHTLAMFEGNMITEDEAREEIGREPFTDKDREKTYWRLVTLPRTILQSVDEPGLQGPLAKKLFGVSPKKISQTEEPKNQYGTKKKAGPPANDREQLMIRDSINIVQDNGAVVSEIKKKYHALLLDQYDSILSDMIDSYEHDNKYDYKSSLRASRETVIDKSSGIVVNLLSLLSGNNLTDKLTDDKLKFYHNINIRNINDFFDDIQLRLSRFKTISDAVSIFESQRYRINILLDWYLDVVRKNIEKC